MEYIRYDIVTTPIEHSFYKEIQKISSKISKVIIEGKESNVEGVINIFFYSEEFYNIYEAEQDTKTYVTNLLNALIIEHDICTKSYYVSGHNINCLASGSIEIINKIKKVAKLNEQDLEKLKQYMIDEKYSNRYFNIYRYAFNTEDIISKYMILYNILLEICNDKQRCVDDFITAAIGKDEAEYKQSPRKLKKGDYIYETKFTKLRNEIGHARENTTIDKTTEEMELNIDKLAKLVLKAIKSKEQDGNFVPS
ncbi:hypothetical protein [Clostridium algidicarnis]|uniref:RiboL-PSP-HEPN domain-containing protein n=1 Tax=Clostridium algidicarnis TaxID=37659 RepID=A0ABS6C6B5_9CLOT|nr:hypothetical protein [Clostridium algidicarnis]MBU3221038.1 hypothetical protein [Clostridium algidicarnis]